MKNLAKKSTKSTTAFSIKMLMGVVLFLLLLVLLIPEITQRKVTFRESDIATHDFYAPCRFAVPDYEATEALRRKAMISVLPVYNFNAEVTEARKKALNEFFGRIEKAKIEREKTEEKKPLTNDEIEKLKGGLKLNEETISDLMGDVELKEIKEKVECILNTILGQGVINSRENLPEGQKEVVLRKKDIDIKKDVGEIIILKEIDSVLRKEAEKAYPTAYTSNLIHRKSIIDMVQTLVTENVSADKSETLSRKEKVSGSVPLQYRWVEEDEIIVRKGEKINNTALAEIKAMEDTLSKGRQPLRIIGVGLLVGIAIVVIFFYLRLLEPAILGNLSYLSAIGLILIVILIIARLTISYNLSFFLVPVAAGSMLVTILFGPGVGSIIALLLSLFTGYITRFKFLFLLTGLSSSVVGIYGIKDARHRSDIIKAGLLAGCTGLMVIFAWNLTNEVQFQEALMDSLIGLGNGFICALLVAGCLPFFEYFLKVTTNIRLLELSDLNHPLLKDMSLKAPGSFQSSIMTGTLAEAAAVAIGANALLARVGAYYHDIGKIRKPAYFTENQPKAQNRHERLSSNISGLILISHVKDGVELARQHRLPNKIINIIQEHHGTTLVFYFYQKALEEKKGEDIEKEDFRYTGPKPQTKEAAIVMLADSVEAASRTLADPTPGSIENLVKKIINNKFIDYQLDECELTLKDLNKIGQSFVHHITGILHSRVEYPDEEKVTQGSDKKPPEKEKTKSG